MNFNKLLKRLYSYLLSAITIQIFITLVALPILVNWGLPISSLTIFGNILFAPVLTLFLLLSSLIFFSELLYIPNQSLIYLLEKLTSFWLKIVPQNPKLYFLAFPQNSWWMFMLGLAAVTATILYLQTNKTKQTIIISLILFSSCILAKLPFWESNNHITLKNRTQKMEIYSNCGEITIHDYGALNYYCGTENWIKYTLVPTIIKNFGTLKIKKLVIHKPVKSTTKNIKFINKQLIINNLEIKNPAA